MMDNQPRYTTKRLHDEIDKAKAYARREALEEAAALCDAIANRPVQAPESGAWERAERHTAKRLAAEIRALVTINASGATPTDGGENGA